MVTYDHCCTSGWMLRFHEQWSHKVDRDQGNPTNSSFRSCDNRALANKCSNIGSPNDKQSPISAEMAGISLPTLPTLGASQHKCLSFPCHLHDKVRARPFWPSDLALISLPSCQPQRSSPSRMAPPEATMNANLIREFTIWIRPRSRLTNNLWVRWLPKHVCNILMEGVLKKNGNLLADQISPLIFHSEWHSSRGPLPLHQSQSAREHEPGADVRPLGSSSCCSGLIRWKRQPKLMQPKGAQHFAKGKFTKTKFAKYTEVSSN